MNGNGVTLMGIRIHTSIYLFTLCNKFAQSLINNKLNSKPDNLQ